MRTTRAVVYLDNLRRNIRGAREKAGSHRKICFPVKGDAYGHGAVPLSRCALEAGVEYLAVAVVSEGAELRAAGISAPILLFAQALPEEIPDIISQGLIPLVSDPEFVGEVEKAAQKANKKVTMHLKVNTGMGRVGCRPEDAVSLATKISSSKWLCLEGTATHLSVADSLDPDNVAYTKEQLRRFRETVDSLKKAGLNPGIVHAANSGGLVFHEDSYFDMIRPGIFFYGYSPADHPSNKRIASAGLSAEPLMQFKSVVVAVKKVRKGEAVSYGRTWIAPEDTLLGVLQVGYTDGFTRVLSNNYSVQIRGKTYPVVGRICMDQCMINLGSKTDVQRWDEVVIFGPGFVSAGDIADMLKTVPHEITCNINKRVPREYVG